MTNERSSPGDGNSRGVLEPQYLWLLAAPLLVLLATETALFALIQPGDEIQPGKMPRSYVPQVGANLIGMLSTFSLMAIACLGAIGYFILFAWRRLTSGSFQWVIFTAGGIAIAVIAGSFILKEFGNRQDWLVFGRISDIGSCVQQAWTGCGLYFLTWMLRGSSTLLILAATAIVFGTMLSLATPECSSRSAEGAQAAADGWLLIAAVVLVTGLAFHQAWGKWLISLWGKDSLAPIVNAFTAFNGARFSCFMATYYLPITFILWAGMDGVGKSGSKDGKINEHASPFGPDLTAVKATFAILSPFIAGLLAPLVSFGR